MSATARNRAGRSGKKTYRASWPFNAPALRRDAISVDCREGWRFIFKCGRWSGCIETFGFTSRLAHLGPTKGAIANDRFAPN